MKKAIELTSHIIILSLVAVIFGALINDYAENHIGYSYITMQDKKGISIKCYTTNEGLFCKTKDGLVEVKQFGKR